MPEQGKVLAAGQVLAALSDVIDARRGGNPAASYTSRLLAGGPEATGRKVTEEASELVAAACGETDERVVSEAADLFYHALVLLACRGLSLTEVESELARRFGVSGLAEKAARTARLEGGSA
jgi:phosphoribosyl-ATP pyrophosphohydrolase